MLPRERGSSRERTEILWTERIYAATRYFDAEAKQREYRVKVFYSIVRSTIPADDANTVEYDKSYNAERFFQQGGKQHAYAVHGSVFRINVMSDTDFSITEEEQRARNSQLEDSDCVIIRYEN
jgi:hypothetical protein